MSRMNSYENSKSLHHHEGDIAELRKAIPELERFNDRQIEIMYGDYSDTYAASWLALDEDTIESFKWWLKS